MLGIASVLLASTIAASALVAAPPGGFPATALVSRAPGPAGAGGDRSSQLPSVSANGRYVAFQSAATNFRAGGARTTDVYRRDMQTGEVVLVSRADGPSGAAAEGGSYSPSISADGRIVAFGSYGVNLSADGSTGQIFVRDIDAGTTTLVSRADGTGLAADQYSSNPEISADGLSVAFTSTAVLTPGAPADEFHLYVRDLDTGTTDLVSQPTDGTIPSPTVNEGAAPTDVSLSGDGGLVAFSSGGTLTDDEEETAGTVDVFVRNRVARTTSRIVTSRDGSPCGGAYPDISAGGRHVVYVSCDGRLAVRDLATGETDRVSKPVDISGPGSPPSISASGSRVAYLSGGPQDSPISGSGTDIYAINRDRGVTVSVARASGQGLPGDAGSSEPQIADGGNFVVFVSKATNLSGADLDKTSDVFRRQLFFTRDGPLPVCGEKTVTKLGSPGRDVLIGTPRADVIDGAGGNDLVRGLGGGDILCGGPGRDRVNGGADDSGRSAYDRLFGGPGADRVKLVEGGGSARGGPGNDVVLGSDTDDSGDDLDGGTGNDVLRGLGNADYNPDYLRGGPGDDDLFGGGSDDQMNGQNGNDRLFGGPGDDTLVGGAGRDLLDFGSEPDR